MGVSRLADVAELSYCPSCGSRLVDGACPAHGEPLTQAALAGADHVDPAAPVPVPAAVPVPAGIAAVLPRGRGRVAMAVTALVVVTVVVALVSSSLRSTSADVDELRDARRSTAGALKDVSARLAAAEAGLNGLSSRISELEAARDATPDTAEVAARVQRSVFTVETDEGEGSGWMLTSGKVVTNFHVIADGWLNDRPNVTLHQDDSSWPAKVVEVSPANDLAVIAVVGDFTPLERGTERPKVGDPVLAVGSPLGLGGTVSSGIVSAYRSEDGVEYLQFSAAISPGSSGGPVVDASGRVVAVSVAKYVGSGAEGLSFAIPVARVCDSFEAC